ncbi:XTP/dITP diphosphatase [Apilactobacillus sp. M161]|uniref:dITP/XTP pyrophosphatase n=1 Tax=Apilactobacillus xinyiensis TaxID=2841032 RepID=A0ABT0I1R7_9LACO|nr:XTP/dITP diphosphatase [Apilactobacillus xinyiensis]MCK8624662.1 XTP/dITP diphosphatase [Apilactobacillus xinyiensis]
MGKTLILATNNDNKAREFQEMFNPLGIHVKTLKDFPNAKSVSEDGNSFEENATLKALNLHKQTHLPVIADDSGLQVFSLNGAPGIYSARYAGDHDDDANNQKLLKELSDKSNRDARFVTCLVLITQDNSKIVVHGYLNGQITHEPVGFNGFGYDPLFYVPEKCKTLAEMSDDEKNNLSHRGNALKKMFNIIENNFLN